MRRISSEELICIMPPVEPYPLGDILAVENEDSAPGWRFMFTRVKGGWRFDGPRLAATFPLICTCGLGTGPCPEHAGSIDRPDIRPA